MAKKKPETLGPSTPFKNNTSKKNTLVQITPFKNSSDLLNVYKPQNTFGILTDDPIIAATPHYERMAVSSNKSKGLSTETPATLKLGNYNYNDIYNNLYSAYGGGSSGGGYNPVKTDISGLLAAYEQEAASQREIAQRNYDLATQQAREKYNLTESSAAKQRETTRGDLLTSLKRFQAQNARDVEDQKQAYLTSQANLEAAREAANRQSRISNAARGLAGSGLQQLEQMQNLINQGQQISELAGENQTVRENLARALSENKEDYDTNIAKAEDLYNETIKNAQAEQKSSLDTLLNNYTNTLSGIASALESQRETAIANNETAYTNAVNQARAQAAQRASSNRAASTSAKQEARSLVNLLNSTQAQYEKELKALNGMSSSDLKELAKNTYKLSKKATKRQVANAINEKYQNLMTSIDPNSLGYATQYGLSKNNIKTYTNNLNSLLKYYGY